MSEVGQSRRFDGGPATSGLTASTDIIGDVWLVCFVPIAVMIRCRQPCKVLLMLQVCIGILARKLSSNWATCSRLSSRSLVPEKSLNILEWPAKEDGVCRVQ